MLAPPPAPGAVNHPQNEPADDVRGPRPARLQPEQEVEEADHNQDDEAEHYDRPLEVVPEDREQDQECERGGSESRICLSTRGRPPSGRDFHRQQAANPIRCQRTTVSGLTMVMASRMRGKRR